MTEPKAALASSNWRLAKSLEVLGREVDSFAPRRKKFNDGTIGDAAHAARASRHNPNNAGVVCARDITHDPEGGMDVHALARRLVKNPHPDLAYVISNRQGAYRSEGFKWRAYGGSHPHDMHAHFAVGTGPDSEPRPPYDDLTPWGVKEDDMTAEEVRQIVKEELESYTETVWDEGQVREAQKALVDAKLIERARPSTKLATISYVDILAARLLKALRPK